MLTFIALAVAIFCLCFLNINAEAKKDKNIASLQTSSESNQTVSQTPPIAPPIKIGAIYNLTGPQSILDRESVRGAQLAVKQINAAGGLLNQPIELVIMDGHSNPTIVAHNAEQLAADSSIISVIGLNDTDLAIAAIAPITMAKKIFLSSGATSPKLSALAPQYVFFTCFCDNHQAAAAAEFAVKDLHTELAYMLTQNDMEYTRLLGSYFQQNYLEKGGKIAANDTFTSQDIDISKQLQKLKASNTHFDLIYVASDPTFAPTIIRQIRTAGFNEPIIGGDSFDSTALSLKNEKFITNNVYFTTHAFINKNNPDPSIRQFISDYVNTYQQEPETSFAGLGYDTVKIMAQAIQLARSTSTADLRASLLNINDFNGITGIISYKYGNSVPEKTVTIIQIQNGKKMLAKELRPTHKV